MIIGPAYCVMFGAGPPAPHQSAALARWKRTTLAYMGARSQQQAAKDLGIKYVGAHVRALYSHLTTGDLATLTEPEYKEAYEWGDWAALSPGLWIGPRRLPGTMRRLMMYERDRKRSWPYRIMAALDDAYGLDVVRETGLFLDADTEEWEGPLWRLAEIATSESIPLYLNGGRFRELPITELMRFRGIFYEAVHVGAEWEAESRDEAEKLLAHCAVPGFWTGIQIRFASKPSDMEVGQWSRWFLKVRKTRDQTATFVVQPPGSFPEELPCPNALDPAIAISTQPREPKRSIEDAEMP